MAVDMFMKIKNIAGESRDKTHAGEIDVLAWSWGMTNSGTAHLGGGAGAGKVNVQDISFTKYIDKASPLLQLACATGQHIEEAVLIVRKAGGSPIEYVKITMSGVFVTSVSTGGSGGEDRLTENIVLNFAKVKMEYQEQDDKGAKKGGPVQYTYDISKNVKA